MKRVTARIALSHSYHALASARMLGLRAAVVADGMRTLVVEPFGGAGDGTDTARRE